MRLPTKQNKNAAPTPKGSVEVILRDKLMRCRRWARAFEGERKDHRYYEIVEDTILQGYEYRYFAIKDANGDVRAIQPFFILDQDLLVAANSKVEGLIEFIRRAWPRFMRMRLLKVGCAAGEGHLDNVDVIQSHCQPQLLASAIVIHARRLKVSLIVLKEFPAK